MQQETIKVARIRTILILLALNFTVNKRGLHLACVASVSNRVIARKVERNLLSPPPPPSFILFFALVPAF